MEILLFLLGIPTGVLASIAGWAILFRAIVPRLSFSPVISKVERREQPLHFEYRVKLLNSGRRGVLDLRISVRLFLRISAHADVTTVTEFALSKNSIPRLPRESRAQIISLDVDRTEPFADFPFPKEIRDKYSSGDLALEDVMRLDPNARIKVLIFGYDEFSGARRLMESQYYSLEDVVVGPFERNSLRTVATQPLLRNAGRPKDETGEGGPQFKPIATEVTKPQR